MGRGRHRWRAFVASISLVGSIAVASCERGRSPARTPSDAGTAAIVHDAHRIGPAIRPRPRCDSQKTVAMLEHTVAAGNVASYHAALIAKHLTPLDLPVVHERIGRGLRSDLIQRNAPGTTIKRHGETFVVVGARWNGSLGGPKLFDLAIDPHHRVFAVTRAPHAQLVRVSECGCESDRRDPRRRAVPVPPMPPIAHALRRRNVSTTMSHEPADGRGHGAARAGCV